MGEIQIEIRNFNFSRKVWELATLGPLVCVVVIGRSTTAGQLWCPAIPAIVP